MSLPEYELSSRCLHDIEIARCDDQKCEDILLGREHEYIETRLAHAAETGEYDDWQD